MSKLEATQIKETTWAYIAGMIDGEGCIMLFRHYKKSGASKRGYEVEPRLNISSMNKRNIEVIKDSIKLGNIVTMRFKRNGELASIGYDLRFGPNAQRIIYPKILPYLVQKKERAELILKLLDYRSQKPIDPVHREKFYLELEDQYRALIIKERPWLLNPTEQLAGKLGVQNSSLVKAYQTHAFVPGRKKCLATELMADKKGEP